MHFNFMRPRQTVTGKIFQDLIKIFSFFQVDPISYTDIQGILDAGTSFAVNRLLA